MFVDNNIFVPRSADEWKTAHQKMLKSMKKDRRRNSNRPMSAMDNIEIRG